MNSYIGLMTRCKDEYFISEFVEYYLSQGIDHIYIIDDDSDDKSIYEDLLDNNKVNIIYGNIEDNYVNEVYGDIKDNYEWIIYVDVDEFITTRRNNCKTIRDELSTTFKNVDCIMIPWVMMGCKGIKDSPERILTSNIYRWSHDKKHPNTIHKFRCRYEKIEVKCIFKPKLFDAIWDHHPKKPNRSNLRIVNGIDCSDSLLSSFIDNLREADIESGFLLCYHYRIISVENCLNKIRTNRFYNNYTINDLLRSDYNEVEDKVLKHKSLKIQNKEA